MAIKMDMLDVSLISNDIYEAFYIMEANFNGELSDDEETLIVQEADITELKKFLFSALTQLQEYH